MQRFHRYGTVSLVLIIIALTCHLLAISLAQWKTSTCNLCSPTYNFRQYTTSIRQRCYSISLLNYYNLTTDLNAILNDPFTSYVCIPNQFLFPTHPNYTDECLAFTELGPHSICTTNIYDTNMCKCDYSKNTKAVVAFAVISSVTLGCMVILAHIITFIEHSFILRWLLPAGFISMMVACFSMVIILSIEGYDKDQELNYILGWWSPDLAANSTSSTTNNTELSIDLNANNYDVKIGLSFGMEIIALDFTLSAAVIYAMMFFAKDRPVSEN